jgi:hypothetical protein
MAGTNINETNSRCEVNESDSIPWGNAPCRGRSLGKALALLLMRGNDHEAKQQ